MQTMDKERNLAIVVPCDICGKSHRVFVNNKDWEEYYNSEHRRYIQDIFPYLTPVERELLISGVCPECWEDLFSEE